MARNIAAAFVAVIVGLALATAGVSAHARYASSTPGKGEILAASPASVTITFTQDVQKISGTYRIDVSGSDGASVTAGETTLDDDNRSIMTVPLQAALAPGRYVVNWKNASDADGDSAEGAFSFYVGVEPTAADLAADAELAAIGGEDETPQATTDVPATVVAEESVQATPSVPILEADDDDGGANIPLIAGGAIIVLAVVGVGAWFAMRGSRAS